jgi:WD40 repeat protein
VRSAEVRKIDWIVMKRVSSSADPLHGSAGEPPFLPCHQLLRRIGSGSYGEVWIALNASQKWCAVKIVYRDEQDSRAYQQEFRGLRRYDALVGLEASLMPVRNVGEDPGGRFFYYEMELADDASTKTPLPAPDLDGKDMDAHMAMVASYRPWTLSEELRQRGRLGPDECVGLGIALAGALEAIHAGGLIHRDVKPSNIIFVHGRPKLADVGLIAAVDATFVSLAGTSGFVPLHGSGTESGDIFALGKVLYLMATGRSIEEFPAESMDLAELQDSERRAWAEIRAVFDRACDHTPEDRHGSAKELREELELLRRNESVLRLRQLEEERVLLQEQSHRQRLWARGIAVVALVLVIGGGAAFRLNTLRIHASQQMLLAELEATQFSRMKHRREGWSTRDWERARQVAQTWLADEVISQAAATLSGLDMRQVGYWRDVEATSVAFSGEGEILLAGHGLQRAMTISGFTHRSDLAVPGEGKVAWPKGRSPLILLPEQDGVVLRDARSGARLSSWPFREGERVARITGPALALSQCGTIAAASLVAPGGSHRTILWDLQNGGLLGEMGELATALAFSEDGHYLAAGGPEGVVKLFSTDSLRLLETLRSGLPRNPITALAFGRDQRIHGAASGPRVPWLLAAADLGTGIVVWDLTARAPRSYCRGSTWNVQSLAFHPDGQTLASAGRNGVLLWDAMTGDQLLVADSACSGDTRALAFDSSGQFLVAGSTSESQFAEVSIWKLEWERGIRHLRGLTTTIRKVWFSPDSRSVAALSDEWLLAVWDIDSSQLRSMVDVHHGSTADTASCAFDFIGQQLLFVAGTSAAHYDLATGKQTGAWTLPEGVGEALRFEEDRWLVARIEQIDGARIWRIYEVTLDGVLHRVHSQTDLSYAPISLVLPVLGHDLLLVSRDLSSGRNHLLAICTRTGQTRWNLATDQSLAWFQIRADPAGQWIAYEPDSSISHLLRSHDGSFVQELAQGCAAISRSGRLWAVQGREARWILLENHSRQDRVLISTDGLWSQDAVHFSPDDRFLAAGKNNGSVLLADIDLVRSRLGALFDPGWRESARRSWRGIRNISHPPSPLGSRRDNRQRVTESSQPPAF